MNWKFKSPLQKSRLRTERPHDQVSLDWSPLAYIDESVDWKRLSRFQRLSILCRSWANAQLIRSAVRMKLNNDTANVQPGQRCNLQTQTLEEWLVQGFEKVLVETVTSMRTCYGGQGQNLDVRRLQTANHISWIKSTESNKLLYYKLKVYQITSYP